MHWPVEACKGWALEVRGCVGNKNNAPGRILAVRPRCRFVGSYLGFLCAAS